MNGFLVPNRHWRKMLAGMGLLIAVGLIFLNAPNYLIVESGPKAADAAVLFAGPDMHARRQEVDVLVKNGVATFVMTPAFGKIDHSDIRLSIKSSESTGPLKGCPKRRFKNFRICENTHREMLIACKMMKQLGLRSAVLVSSPYHMRRIKIIAESVFEKNKYTLAYRPTRYEQTSQVWFFSAKDIKWVFSEYCKIIWFHFYSRFL